MKSTTIAGRAARAMLAAALLPPALGAAAHGLQDPTRPPAAALAPAGQAAVSSSGPQLQSILIGREAGGRKIAVIDGETVRTGDSFHGARVARIGADEVELVRAGEREVLKLYAQADTGSMDPVKRAAAR